MLGLNGQCVKYSKKPRDEVEEFSIFELAVPNSTKKFLLQQLINISLNTYTTDSEMKCDCCTNFYDCTLEGDCRPEQISAKRSILQEPDVLLIQLKRLPGVFSNVWPDDKITLPSSTIYELSSIGHHIGQSNNSGHYVASVRRNKKWYRCNDTKVSLITENEAKSLLCDICVYTRVPLPVSNHEDDDTINCSKEPETISNNEGNAIDCLKEPVTKSNIEGNAYSKCKNCGKSFALFLSHLMRSKQCQMGYNLEKIRNELDTEKKKRATLLKQQWRQQMQKSDIQSYKQSMATEKSKQRAAKRANDEMQLKIDSAAKKSRSRAAKRQSDEMQ